METSLIEKYDRSRYNLLKWFTIGWAIWFGGFILKDLIQQPIILGIISIVGLFGWFLFLINLTRMNKLGKVIKSNEGLKNALADELSIHNRNKSFIIGFWAFVIVSSVCFGLSIFTNISAFIVCEITIYFGTLSALIASIIYNRG
ncbi:MAG TPA: hypothetical protein VKA27_16790 [Sunxiuqinia sp.]|nr:hypothetical protein [Sunxiuqinia sp.]